MYLPVYLVRATDQRGVRYLLYSQAADRDDPDLTDAYARAREFAGLVENEVYAGLDQFGAQQITAWLSGRGLSGVRPVEHGGAWQVTLQVTAFEPDGPLSIMKVGSYLLLGSSFFRIWTNSSQLRGTVLLARLDTYLSARRRPDRKDLDVHLNRLTRQLDLPDIDLPAAQRLARDTGQTTLARHLAHLA